MSLAGKDGSVDWRSNLEKAIVSNGYKITKLSEELGRHRDYLSNIFSGKASPNAEFLIKLIDHAGLSFSEIFEGKDTGSPDVSLEGTSLQVRLDSVVAAMQEPGTLSDHRRDRIQIDAKDISVKPDPENPLSVSAHATLEKYGAKGYSILCGLPNSQNMYSSLVDDYEFARAYVEQKLALSDPVLEYMNYGVGYSSWSRLRASGGDDAVFKLAEQFGRKSGSVLTNCYRGRKIAVSLCHHDETEELSDEQIEEVESALFDLLVSTVPTQPTDHHFEILDDLSYGLSSSELRDIHGISERRLAQIRDAAAAKLGANNVPHAISIAFDTGILN